MTARAVSWRQTRFCVLDFETTGLDLSVAQPLSVGWVHVVDGAVRMEAAGYAVLRSDAPVPAATLDIHRLTPHDLRNGDAHDVVAERLTAALGDDLLVAHYGRIELTMLAALGIRRSRSATIDTLRLAQRLHRQPDVTLAAAAAREGLPTFLPHHAFGDALTTAWLFLALATRMEAAGRPWIIQLRRAGRVR